jgi:hypothetical protein
MSPSAWKRIERLQVYIDAPGSTADATLLLDPTQLSVGLRLDVLSSGWDWATGSSDSNPRAGEWDVAEWASDTPNVVTTGLPMTATGQRYSLRITLPASGECIFYGYELDYTLLPERRFDR